MAENIGRVVQISGPAVDVQFVEGAMPPIYQALHKRGVKVQMLLNDHQDTHAMKRVRAVLGTNRFAKNFIYKCKQGCRTFADQYRNLHSKFYTFTKTGGSKWALFFGSATAMPRPGCPRTRATDAPTSPGRSA